MKVGKTIIKRKPKKDDQQNEIEIISKENIKSKMIKGKTSLGKKDKESIQKIEEKSSSEFLIEQIIINFCIDKWQKNIIAMQNRVTNKTKKQSKDLRHFIHVLRKIIRYNTYKYLMELFERMRRIPYPEGIVHDPNYGKIIIVNNEEKEESNEEEINNEIGEEIVIEDLTNQPLRNIERNKNNENKNGKIFEQENEELKPYFYRNDGKPLDRIEIEKDINKLIDLNPEKDIDVERILNSKRLQYKLKHPRFSPFTKKENITSFVRYLYTYKPTNDKDKNDNLIFLKNKTYAYY